MKKFLKWNYIAPFIACGYYLLAPIGAGVFVNVFACICLIAGVMASVHHAEVVAQRVGESYGTIILAVAVTLLEASIIVSLMLAGGIDAETYARDTLFAAVMLILNGLLGISMLVGALKHKEQSFETKSLTIALVSLVAILVMTLVLPNYTTSVEGPIYNKPQLVMVTVACVVIYTAFLFTQTIRHRHYFLVEHSGEEKHVSLGEALKLLFFYRKAYRPFVLRRTIDFKPALTWVWAQPWPA